MERTFDFGWGDTRGVREVMVESLASRGILFDRYPSSLRSLGYPPHEGSAELIEAVRDLVKDLTGKRYKHVLITNGATHALNAYVYVKANYLIREQLYLKTDTLYFPFYPNISKIHNVLHVPSKLDFPCPDKIRVYIADSPSNPMGLTRPDGLEGDTVWDAAYFSPTYCTWTMRSGAVLMPKHEAMAGSLNKLTGLNGLRVGWLAMDDDLLYKKAFEYVEADLCGISLLSQNLARDILVKVDLDSFYIKSRWVLDCNRGELEKLGNIFGNQLIPCSGMFALFEVDAKIRRLLEKASVVTTPGHVIGDIRRDSVRINLANTNDETKDMVKAVLKADRI